MGDKEYDWHYFAPLWRWRQDYLNDFKARMDWCVNDYLHAHHPPVVCFMGDTNRTPALLSVCPGEPLALDASGSYNPDNRVRYFEEIGCEGPKEALDFRWYYYPEAGTYAGTIELNGDDQPTLHLVVPEDAAGKQIHIIMETVGRGGDISLKSYRRIVLNVEA